MAICEFCKKGMLKVGTCMCIPFTDPENGNLVGPIKYGDESDDWGADKQRCGDCNVVKGGYHHPGCDVERCPKCGNQAIGCDCWRVT
jgi:hypothetical protein